MSLTIDSIKNHREYFKDIIQLHKENAKTLGFLPEGAFSEAVDNNKILIAINSTKEVVGYLLYGVNKRGNFVYIVHLCVSSKSRNEGVAKCLLQYLVSITNKEFRGIRVNCRREYEATKIWEKLNFVYKHEKAGRSREGSTLFIWWFDFNHPDLFTLDEENEKIKIVLDSNIVYDLMDEKNDKNQNSHALFSDWLEEDVEYCITAQLQNDISHHKDPSIRQASNEFITQFKIVKSDFQRFDQIFKEIKALYDKPLNTREESDIRHLTRTINSEANYFLTKDEGILKKSDVFLEKYSLLVLRPEEFIINFSSLINEIDYHPSRFSGANLSINSPKIEELRQISDSFFLPHNEKKREFQNKIHNTLIRERTTSFLIKNKNEKIVFYIIEESSEILEIKFLRYIMNLRNKTVINQIIFNLIFLALEKNKRIIRLSEEFVDSFLENILSNYGFLKLGQSYSKFVSNDVLEFSRINDYLESHLGDKSLCEAYKRILNEKASSQGALLKSESFFNIERFLFPLKLSKTGISCFIIPIQPCWAMNLFNIKLSSQDLFGGNERLLFNKENVYYRSARPLVLENQSRILWYISEGNGTYEDSMCIAASSYLNEIEIDKPKHLYKKHNRIGVYTWENVLATANNNLESEIMVFSFDLTENFERSIEVKELHTIYQDHLDRNFFYPQAPYKITEEMFFDIYKLGNRKEITT